MRTIQALRDELDAAMLRDKEITKTQTYLKRLRDQEIEEIRAELADAYNQERLDRELEELRQEILEEIEDMFNNNK